MNKDTLRYLADLAIVRGHINTILGISRGVLSQPVMHKVSAKASVLDKMFVETLLSGGINQATTSVQQNNDDFVDITKRLQEEKAKIAAKVNQQVDAPVAAEVADVSEDNESFDDDLFQPPADEVAAFEDLLAQAESSVEMSKPVPEPVIQKRRGRPKKVAQ